MGPFGITWDLWCQCGTICHLCEEVEQGCFEKHLLDHAYILLGVPTAKNNTIHIKVKTSKLVNTA